MKFIMNEQIIFDSDMSTLGLEGSHEELIPVSNTTKRLLLLLIAHQGEAVKREVIFKKVWDDYGMVSSNNNLNQCVSKLRKIVKTLGVDEEVIVTIPKIGFMLHQQIQIEKREVTQERSPVANSGRANPTSDGTNSLPGKTVKPNVAGSSRRRAVRMLTFNRVLLFFSVLSLGGAAGFWFVSKPVDRKEIYMGNAGSCKVMISEQALESAKAPEVKKGIMDLALKLNPVCKSNEYALIIKSSSFKMYTSDLSRLYFLRCSMMNENRSEVCWGLLSPE